MIYSGLESSILDNFDKSRIESTQIRFSLHAEKRNFFKMLKIFQKKSFCFKQKGKQARTAQTFEMSVRLGAAQMARFESTILETGQSF